MSITYSGDKITFPDGSTIANGNQGFKNRIINGDMRIDQRNAGVSITPSASTYTLDRFILSVAAASKLSIQQNAGGVTPPAGFTHYLGVTSLANTSLGAGDAYDIRQLVEGFNIADFGWGTANAKPVTLSFRVRSSLTGTFGGSIANGSYNRSFPFTYSIPSANTWTTISITIPGDTAGTWATNNSVGLYVFFGLGTGASVSGTAGAWVANGYISATGTTSVVGTSGATFYLTGVQLEVGASATSFETRAYGQELALCQRYYWVSTKSTYNSIGSGLWNTSTQAHFYIKHPVSMRSAPTFSYSGTLYIEVPGGSSAVSSIAAQYCGLDSSRLDLNASSSTTAGFGANLFTDNGPTHYIQASAEL